MADDTQDKVGAHPYAGIYERTDFGNAQRLTARYGHALRYVSAWDSWLVWDGSRWDGSTESVGQVKRWAWETIRSMRLEEARRATGAEERDALVKWAVASETKARLNSMVELASTGPGMSVAPDALDADPWLLPCANGTVDLRTGILREHRPEDLFTKLAPVRYVPGARSAVWASFLERVQPDEAKRDYLQRVTGYNLTGSTREELFWLNTGGGGNGKGTYAETVAAAMGEELSTALTASSLFGRGAGRFDLANMHGARRVDVGEVPKGSRMSTDLLKSITGGDPIRAERKYEHAFVFKPTAKIWITANSLPSIGETEDGIWRRLRHITWDVKITDPDETLKGTLHQPEHLEAVLAWAVAGAVEWYANGLQEPVCIQAAGDAYRADEDTLGTFLAEETFTAPDDHFTPMSGLFSAWQMWCGVRGEEPGKLADFGKELTARGVQAGGERGRPRQQRWPGGGRGAVRYGIALVGSEAVTPEDRAWADTVTRQ